MPTKQELLEVIKDFFKYHSDSYKEECGGEYQFIETGVIKLERLANELLEKFLVLKK